LAHKGVPSKAATVPGKHVLQEPNPAVTASEPAGHGVHFVLDALENFPALQLRHKVDASSQENLPSGHVSQVSGVPLTAANFPGTHAKHWLLAPLEYAPALQF
jgi:hypothetical protein